MSVFNVELKKVVDDSYDIEMGYHLEDQLVEDLETDYFWEKSKICRDHGFQCTGSVCKTNQ